MLKHSVFIITNSVTTLCAQCPERKSQLRYSIFTKLTRSFQSTLFDCYNNSEQLHYLLDYERS